MSQTSSTLVEREFRKIVDARILHLEREVGAGNLDDIGTYKKMTGQIEGLKASLDFIEQAAEAAAQQNR